MIPVNLEDPYCNILITIPRPVMGDIGKDYKFIGGNFPKSHVPTIAKFVYRLVQDYSIEAWEVDHVNENGSVTMKPVAIAAIEDDA